MSLEDAGGRTFSDAWHRVAQVRAHLRRSVTAQRQYFRGEAWVVLTDRFGSDWFRVSPDAYAFLCRLTPQCTIDEAWNASLEADLHLALTQEEVVQLLGQLNLSNLLQYDRSDSAASLFDRFSKRSSQEMRALLMGFLSIKIPVLDPDRMLNAALPLIRTVYSRRGLMVYLVLLALGAKFLMDDAARLFDQSAGVLSPSNLPLLYVGFLLSKTLHEFSHAAVCKRFGGEVHKLGVMLLIFAPMPYVDATAAWGFRSRAERVLVGAAGVIAELALASLAAIFWSHTAPGTLNSLAYNVMFVASISTVVFNLNPLMRFDGYHMLVDILDVPNLFQRSREQLRYIGEKHILGLPSAQPAARTPTESVLLPLFGVLSMGYWVLLMSTIIFFIAGEYLDLGIALAFLMLFTALILPLFKFAKYLFTSPVLGFYRPRAIAISGGIAGLAFVVLGLIPVPDHVRVNGVVEAGQSRLLHSDSDGFLAELLARPGSLVQAGQPLLRLRNDELEFDIRSVDMQLDQLLAQETHALTAAVADLKAIARQREAVEQTRADLLRRQQGLLVRAPIGGIWSASDLDAGRGQWLGRGAALGTVVNEGAWRFVAVLPQVASHVFQNPIVRTEVRLRGQEERNLPTLSTMVLPFEQGHLPSRALGMAGGGDIAVSPSDQNGLTSAEPFFRIESALPADLADGPQLVHGRVGTMRITLSNRPLLVQWERQARQYLQRKFRV
jgi:putative peptide zinc metalloprotease protein